MFDVILKDLFEADANWRAHRWHSAPLSKCGCAEGSLCGPGFYWLMTARNAAAAILNRPALVKAYLASVDSEYGETGTTKDPIRET